MAGALRRCAPPRLPCIAERFWRAFAENPMRRHATIKMCRDPRHTFIFHVPEGRASYAEGVLHVPQACFMCRRRASFAEHCGRTAAHSAAPAKKQA